MQTSDLYVYESSSSFFKEEELTNNGKMMNESTLLSAYLIG